MPKIPAFDPALVAAAGLTPNALSNLDDVAEKLLAAPALRERLGLGDWDGEDLDQIGEGAYAMVYRLPDGRVLKLTTGFDDAVAAFAASTTRPRPDGVVTIYEAVRFPGAIRLYGDPASHAILFAIVSEYVPNVYRGDYEADDLEQRNFNAEAVGIAKAVNRRLPLDRFASETRDAAAQLYAGLHWLESIGQRMTDVHAGNIGRRADGSWVLLEFGNDINYDAQVGETGKSTAMMDTYASRVPLAANGPNVLQQCFDECFDVIQDRFPDFGQIDLDEDSKAAADNGHGSERQFGYCQDGQPITIAFAPKTRKLPIEHVRGLMCHEFGHAVDFRYGQTDLQRMLGVRLPAGVERRADAIAKAVFGETIRYGGPHAIQCVGCTGVSPRPRRLGP